MSSFDSWLKRNKEFAAQQSAGGTLMPSLPRALTHLKAIVITCADMRVDPAHVLGIKPGEAVVMRNIGGRVTPGILEELALLGRIGEVAGETAGGGGETRLTGNPDMLAHYFQVKESELKAKAVPDPRAAVRSDVALLRAIPVLPSEWIISGLVYDVATGLVDVVAPPEALRAAA